MKKNAYLEKRRQETGTYIKATEEIIRQMMCDTLTITLHQEFGFGYERVSRVLTAWGANYNHFMNACDIKHPEADYHQEVLDRQLQYICRGHDFYPFKERYPKIKEIKYTRKSKETPHG